MDIKKNFIKKPQISIVILTCNSFRMVDKCIVQAIRLKEESYYKKIIVINNGSLDDISKKIYKKYPDLIIIDNMKNFGFSKGINFGIQLGLDIGSDYIFLLNDDTIFPANFMEILIEKAISNHYLISGPLILTVNKKIWSAGGSIQTNRYSGGLNYYGESIKDLKRISSHPVDFISGTAMLVKSEVFNKIGLLNEDYFLYYDDVDFCYRAKKVNISSFIIPTARIIHLESTTIKKGSPSHYYQSAKGRLIFLFKHAPFIKKLREIVRLPLSIVEIMLLKDKVKRKYELLAYFDFFQHKVGQNTTIKPF